jgi:uncharacterized repeat protein (TIGR03803 family)
LCAAVLLIVATACGSSTPKAQSTTTTTVSARPALDAEDAAEAAGACSAVPADQQAAGNINVMHDFAGTDAANPWGSLVLDGSTLYGRTAFGGKYDNGAVFSIGTDGNTFKTMYSFTAGADNDLGNQPHHDSMQVIGSTLFGATKMGGSDNDAAVFSINTDGTKYRALHIFAGKPNDGAQAHSDFLVDQNTLFGMTALGGANDKGTIFRVNTDGTGYKMLYSFADATGTEPHGRLAFGSDGKTIYGMTRKGGPAGAGVIFSFDPATAAYKVLHHFGTGADNGATPFHGYLTRVGKTFYGMTTEGGSANAGTIFEINEDGSGFGLLHRFGVTKNDGKETKGSLEFSKGYLYGESFKGGPFDVGTAFRIKLDGSGYQQLAYFGGSVTGAFPYDNVAISADGKTLYGMSGAGGKNDPTCEKKYGTIYSIDIVAMGSGR